MMSQKKIYIPNFSKEYREQYKALILNNTPEQLRLICLKFYSNGELNCKCCKESNLIFLTLEHPKQDGSKRRKNNHPQGGVPLYTWLILHNFYEELEVLCYNCNIGRFRNHGICPHENGRSKVPQIHLNYRRKYGGYDKILLENLGLSVIGL